MLSSVLLTWARQSLFDDVTRSDGNGSPNINA